MEVLLFPSAQEREIDLLSLYFVQVSYRLFELTNMLKSTFVPSKDNKRLGHNIVAAVVIASGLYMLSFVLLRIPPVMVSFTLLRMIVLNLSFIMVLSFCPHFIC